ncbi:DnaA regulatory inactivator Hda [Aquisalimonas lutea]|uniref:DnaA regulatory inactivator Hda n=1 Tax=Aquisalimonas lutea TaxID=1327750 RepID=UPI0025B47E84|nr:DnaA regulatory inactivator Hda [Aquisalimonas lutea]MDN3519226.1 DnaA regulatory inactivator Hda [Aquisalimonas lutea]
MGPSSPEPVQLPLGIRWEDAASLASFHPAGNARALAAVERLLAGEETCVYLHGPGGTGKSHLLQAAARAGSERGDPVAYLPLSERASLRPEILEGMERLDLLALDDLHCIAADAAWEEALFHAFNRMRDAGTALLLSAADRPDAVGLVLPDLVSRLQWGLRERLRPMDDDDKLAALRHRARLRGLELPAEAGAYLLRRQPRDMDSLFRLLDVLDRAALAEQRRLTIPFLRRVLAAD